MTKLDKYLAEVKERLAKATPGIWCIDNFFAYEAEGYELINQIPDNLDNRNLIAHSHADVNKLLAMVELLRDALEQYPKEWTFVPDSGLPLTSHTKPSIAGDALNKLEELASE